MDRKHKVVNLICTLKLIHIHADCVSGIYSIELVNDNLYEWNIKLYK